jgi:hypothetical protein
MQYCDIYKTLTPNRTNGSKEEPKLSFLLRNHSIHANISSMTIQDAKVGAKSAKNP